jgi:cytosine/adenosine deaminase-related metal-dependent hydrolase
MHGRLGPLVEAGLNPAEALTRATSVPTAAFGLDDRGRIAPGLPADLLLVRGTRPIGGGTGSESIGPGLAFTLLCRRADPAGGTSRRPPDRRGRGTG